MKLIFCLLFLEFIFVQSSYIIDGQLKKYGTRRLSSDRYLRCVYLDLNDFADEKTLYFKITIHDGYFTESSMYYDTDTLYTTGSMNLYKHESYYSSSYGTSIYGSYFDYYTYRFMIDKPSTGNRYLYVGVPNFNYYIYGNYYIEIESLSGFGLSVAVIVIIVIACIAIVAASIIVYFCRRARRASYIAPPVAEYQPPVAAAATAYPPPTYY